MKKKTPIILLSLSILIWIILVCGAVWSVFHFNLIETEDHPSIFIKKEIMSNSADVTSFKFNSTFTTYILGKTTILKGHAKVDIANSKVQMYTTQILPNGDEKKMDDFSLEAEDKMIMLIKRLKDVNKMKSFGVTKLNDIDTFLLRSEIKEAETLRFIETSFKGGSGNYNLKKAETYWYVDKEEKLVLLEIRNFEFETGGVLVTSTWENNYYDYNVPIEFSD